MAGIEYMNDDPAMVDVLYAKVHMKDGSNRWVLGVLNLRGLRSWGPSGFARHHLKLNPFLPQPSKP